MECELYARSPERANLVARIRGTGDGPSLALLSHTDVVLAAPAEWQRDPFGGERVGDEIWGRGALDMKGGVDHLGRDAIRSHQKHSSRKAAKFAEKRKEIFAALCVLCVFA